MQLNHLQTDGGDSNIQEGFISWESAKRFYGLAMVYVCAGHGT